MLKYTMIAQKKKKEKNSKGNDLFMFGCSMKNIKEN